MFHVNHQTTITALSTAPGRAGIAVLRVSGPLADMVVRQLTGQLPTARLATVVGFTDPADGVLIDKGLVIRFPGPASFTGEDIAELHVHGSRAVVARMLATLVALGCRLAEPGEFARRAFENGKLDLTAAEGLADLIDAETEAQRRQALAQSSGALGRLYDGWRDLLIQAMGLTEAAIDFSDEGDVAGDAMEAARAIVLDVARQIQDHLADGRRGEILREGFRVVLAGRPNAGKSSLLNALAQREVAIVSAEAGTTRDVIEVRLDLAGYPVIVSDTAGVREAQGDIEREGIRRAIAAGREADLVVWLDPAGCEIDRGDDPPDFAGVPVLRIASKADLDAGRVGLADGAVLAVSAKTAAGLGELVDLIAKAAADRIGVGEQPALTQARHRSLLARTLAHLVSYGRQEDRLPEVLAEELRQASVSLGRITGKIDAETVLDVVFSRFCIGK